MDGHQAEVCHGDSVPHVPSPFARDQLSPAMQRRYGLDRAPVGRWIAVVGIAVAFVAVLVYVGAGLTRNQVQTKLVTWDLVQPDRVDLRIDIRRPPTATVICVVRAQDFGHADVGYATITLPPGDEHAVITYSMRVLAPAYATDLLGCSTDGPPQVDPPQFPVGVVPPAQPY